jgi:hypothetical protein
MKYLLACRVNGETLYLADLKGGVLTRHKAGAAVYLSRTNAEAANTHPGDRRVGRNQANRDNSA